MSAEQVHKGIVENARRLRQEAEQQAYERQRDLEDRTQRRYDPDGKMGLTAYGAAAGHMLLEHPNGAISAANPVGPNVDMRHEARLRGKQSRRVNQRLADQEAARLAPPAPPSTVGSSFTNWLQSIFR